jgi:hypothetical protein
MAQTESTPEIVFLGPGAALALCRYANAGGSTGGDIEVGMSAIKGIQLTPTKDAVTNAHVYNETLPLGDITAPTIVTGANEGGSAMIYGEL